MNDSYQHRKGWAWKWTTVINIETDELENERQLSALKKGWAWKWTAVIKEKDELENEWQLNRRYCAKFEMSS